MCKKPSWRELEKAGAKQRARKNSYTANTVFLILIKFLVQF